MVAHNNCSQQAKNFKFLSSEISYESEEVFLQKLAKLAQILRIRNDTFKPNLVQKVSRIKVYDALVLASLV